MPEAYFDEPQKAQPQFEPGFMSMPSWGIMSMTINSLLVPGKKKERPELFASSREAKCMPTDEVGRRSVGLVSSQQLKGVKEDELLFPDPSTFGHENNTIDVDAKPIVDMLLKEKPPPPPTRDNLRARAEREKADTVGTIKPSAPKPYPELDVHAWLKHSVFSVEATGGKLRYPPRPVEHKPEAPNPFANSIFAPLPARWASEPARPRPATQPVQGPDWDLNGWIKKSIFHDDPKLKSEKRRQEEQEERQLRARLQQNNEERERIKSVRFEEDRRRDLEAGVRSVAQRSARSDAPFAPLQYVSPPGPERPASSALRMQVQPAARPLSAPLRSQPPSIPVSRGTTRLHAGAMVVEDFVNSETDVHVSAVNETPVVIRNCSAVSGSRVRIFLHGACRGVLLQGCKHVSVCADQIHESLLIENSVETYLGTAAPLPPSSQVKDAPGTTIFCPKDTATTTLQLTRSAPMNLLLAPAQRGPFPPEQVLSGRNCYEVPLTSDGVQRFQNGQLVDMASRQVPEAGGSEASVGAGSSGQFAEGQEKPVSVLVVLDEDFDQVAGDRGMQAMFCEQLVRELAGSCHANARRFVVQSVQRGSVVVEVSVLSDAADHRTPIQLAAQLLAMARDPGSHLRFQRTFRHLERMECADLKTAGSQGTGITTLSGSPKGGKAGIGIVMDVTNTDGIPLVLEVNPGGPADMSGQIRQGDRVLQIDGRSTLGMPREELVEGVSGLPGSVVRLRLREPTGAEKTVTLTRRVTPVNQRLADAASMIADSFKSPAYKLRKGSQDITSFQDTYTKKAVPQSSLAAQRQGAPLSPALEEATLTNYSGSPSAYSPASPDSRNTTYDRSQMLNQSLAAPQHLAVAQPPVQSVLLAEQQQQQQQQQPPPFRSSPPATQQHSPSGRQALAEENLRAELARAQRQAETQQQHALRASQFQGAADIPDVPPAPAIPSQPRTAAPPPQPAPQPPAEAAAPPPPPPQAAAKRPQVQHKYSAITPARPPPPGAPRVVATVVGASNLPVTDKFGVCNPYVIMAIGSSFHKTTVKQGSLDPQWDETYEFPVQPALLQGMLLTLTVEDHAAALRDEPIGQLSIPLLQLMVRKEWSGAFDLRTMKSADAGETASAVHLRLRYDPGTEP